MTGPSPLRSAEQAISQIMIWESTTRIEAGIKRELFARDRWPSVRACRSAKAVAEKRSIEAAAVLVLDGSTLRKWFEQYATADLQQVQAFHWEAIVAVVQEVDQPDWQWASCGITAVLAGPINDRQLADTCLQAIRFDV